MQFTHQNLRRGVPALFVSALFASSSQAQISFSVDYESSTVSIEDCGGVPITEADILSPALGMPAYGPLATPCIVTTGGAGGLGLIGHAACIGHAPGTTCRIEVDALSHGKDGPPLQPQQQIGPETRFFFSVDEYATGLPLGFAPTVFTEGSTGAREAAADVFVDFGLTAGPLPPFGTPLGGNVGAIDGNGIISTSFLNYPGLGLHERNLPALTVHEGDNLDAYDIGGPIGDGTYFSLDASFVDPMNGLPLGFSAIAQGFLGGDVLFSPAGFGGPSLYAPAFALGLDMIGGQDSDDLDALLLFENGVPGYQRSSQPYDWLGGGTDQLLFSVRRGSAVIGAPDSIFGIPIEPGDILVPPVPTALGGVSPFPGIFIAAENLGLTTTRSGTGGNFGDELDALDYSQCVANDCDANGIEDAVDVAAGFAPDCNANGRPDSCDIAMGLSTDLNFNGVPDECDWGLPTPYCTAKVSSLGVTCVPMIDSEGTPSVTNAKPFLVKAENINNFVNGILFYGYGSTAVPFLGGTLCVSPPLRRMPIMNSLGSMPFPNCSGSYTLDFGAHIGSGVDPFLTAGTSVFAQWWYRDTPNTFNTGLSNALRMVICP